jgi:hypothetical protein
MLCVNSSDLTIKTLTGIKGKKYRIFHGFYSGSVENSHNELSTDPEQKIKCEGFDEFTHLF